MFRVECLESALDELTAIWVDADSSLPHAITAATHHIDLELNANLHDFGESREQHKRIGFASPLAVSFVVDSKKSIVRVLHVWAMRRRK